MIQKRLNLSKIKHLVGERRDKQPVKHSTIILYVLDHATGYLRFNEVYRRVNAYVRKLRSLGIEAIYIKRDGLIRQLTHLQKIGLIQKCAEGYRINPDFGN